MHKHYDTLVVGPISLDQNIDYQDFERREVGGAIVQSGFAAAHSGNVTAIFTKLNPKDADPDAVFAGTAQRLRSMCSACCVTSRTTRACNSTTGRTN